MSAIERWRRAQGLRSSESPHLRLPPPLPVIDSCLLRMDAPSINDTLANKSVGSILGSVRIATGTAVAGNLIGQLPGPTGAWTALVAADPTKFFKPGHWRIFIPYWLRSGTTANSQVDLAFTPWNSASQAFVARPFLGGTGSAFSAPTLSLISPLIGGTRESQFEFEAFFPEPWGVLVTMATTFGAADSAVLNFLFQLHCPLDDQPEAISPFIVQP